MIILFLKSQQSLFDAPVQVPLHVRKDGVVVAPYTRIQKVAPKKPEPVHAQHALFDDAPLAAPPAAAPAPKAAAPAPAPAPAGITLASKKRVKVDMEGTHTAVTLSNGKSHRIQKLDATASMGVPGWHDLDQAEHSYLADTEGDAIARLVERAHFDAPAAASAPKPAPAPDAPWGVPAGISKPARREINARVAQLVADGQVDKDLMRQYSGNGGCGDSLNEYYTDPDVASAMWSTLVRLGATHGTALEPSCATGVFLHTAPEGFKVTGVELDPVSAACALALHGDRHEIHTASLERFATADDRQFDVVIGNPPYGPRGFLAKDDKKHLSTAEGYFVDTSLDKCKPGGLVALVVPTGIMDSRSGRALREDILRKAEFLGAQRMPNTAFEHSHTEVTTDIVYLRKRGDDVAGALATVDQTTLQKLGIWDEEFLAGTYFTGRGADNVLGTMTEGWRAKAGMGNDITVEGSMSGVPAAIAKFAPDSVSRGAGDLSVPDIIEALPDEADRNRAYAGALRRPYANLAKVGDTKIVDGVSYVLQGDPPRWHRVDEFMQSEAISDAQAIAADIDRLVTGSGAVDRPAIEQRVRDYVKKHGIPANNPDLMVAASVDKTLFRLVGAVNRKGELSDAVLGAGPRKVEGGFDAQAEALALGGADGFTADDLAERLGKPVDEVLDQLTADQRYASLGGDRWTTMDAYLTGELWPKLDAARAAIEVAPEGMAEKLRHQAKRLEETIDPRSLDDVDFQLNSAFLPLHVIEAYFNWRMTDGPHASEWTKKQPPQVIKFADGVYTLEGGLTWSDGKLLDKYLNRTGVRKEDRGTVDDWNAEFKEWLCASQYRDAVEELYNRKFRGFVAPSYSDAPIDVPGLTTDLDVRSWRWSSLRRSLADGKGIIADDVGLGKTLGGMLLARMAKMDGRAKKPIIVVPKSVLANWFSETQVWFPGSRVLTIGANFTHDVDGGLVGRDDDADERKRKYHDLTQNDYDFILISEPAFEEIDLDPKTKADYYGDDFWVQRGDKMGNAGDKRRKKIKEAYEQSLAKREFSDHTDAIHFNELGVDMLIADEMHHQKNLYAARARYGENPKFLGGQGQSNRALDFNLKTRWVREQNGGKGVYGLTATPTKNSPLEIYSMLSHIAPEAFERIGVRNSEEFLDRFCEFENDKILSTSGDIEDALVVSGFKNLTELREIMTRFIDRRTADDVGLKLPRRDDRMHLVDMTPKQQEVYAELRALVADSKEKDATGDAHIFSIMDKMNKAALDLSLYDPAAYGGAASPKYGELASQVKEGLKEGAQLIFSEYIASHDRMIDALVDAGVPRKRIGVINAQVAGSAVKRQNIAEALNTGKLDVVIGNATMAEGLNMQKRTTDIHHMDVPWEPATLQQRNGRGLRQGNRNEALRIHTYLSRGSFDGYRYQAVSAKKDWQDLLWRGGDRVDNLAREGKFTRDEMNIMLAADPEAARAEFEKDKAAAEQRHAAGERLDANKQFVRFQEMSKSFRELKNKGTASAHRLQQKLQAAKTALFNNKHFPAKSALDSESDVLIEPNTGAVLHAGVGLDYGKEGKFVVSGVNTRAGTVTMRRYAEVGSGRPVTVPLAELAADIKPFALDKDAEAAEVAVKLESAAGEKLHSLNGFEDLKDIPSHILEANHDAIQRQLKEGVKAYKFSPPDGPMINRATGKLEHVPSYKARGMGETHDYLLATDANREKVINAYMDARRRATFGHDYVSKGGRSKQTTTVARRKYHGADYNMQHVNPFKSSLDKLGGGTVSWGTDSALVKQAKARLETEQLERIRRAPDLVGAIDALLPLGKIAASSEGHSARVTYPKKALTMLWAKARQRGNLADSMGQHVTKDGGYPKHADYAYAHSLNRQGQKRSVHGALMSMARNSGHEDLVSAMAQSAVRHGVEPDARETSEVLQGGFGLSKARLVDLLRAVERAGLADSRKAEARMGSGGLLSDDNQWSPDRQKTIRQIIEASMEHAA